MDQHRTPRGADMVGCLRGRLPAPSFAGVGRDLTCGYQAMSGLPSGIHVRSSGSWIVQSSSSSGDFRLERRACRPARGAYGVTMGVGGRGSRARSAAAGALGGRPGASRRPGCHRRAWRAVAPWRLNEPGSVAVHPWPVVAAAALGSVFISRGRLHPWDDPISTRGYACREELGLLSVVTTPCLDRSVHPVGMMRWAGSPVRLGWLPAVTIGPVPEDASRRCHVHE